MEWVCAVQLLSWAWCVAKPAITPLAHGSVHSGQVIITNERTHGAAHTTCKLYPSQARHVISGLPRFGGTGNLQYMRRKIKVRIKIEGVRVRNRRRGGEDGEQLTR